MMAAEQPIEVQATMAGEAAAADEAPPERRTGELLRGDVIGRYIVLGELGKGGMGVVYGAYDPELDRKIALKLLRPGAGGSSSGTEGRTRLLREAQALAKLSHPNVVSVYDVGTVGDAVWIAMELIEGVTLSEWCSQRTRSANEVLAVFVAAGRGLAAAHAARLIHRDFKPDNVMITPQGVAGEQRVRVMDFGLARVRRLPLPDDIAALETVPRAAHAALAMGVTQVGALMGTPAYMSPEQFRGEQPDARSDQFAFSVGLWEALFGARPFAGGRLVELAAAVISGVRQPPPPGRRVPAWLRRVCERGLASEPADRFADLDQFVAELERGESRTRRRHALAATSAIAMAGLAAFGAHSLVRARAADACHAAGAEIDSVWNDDARDAVRAGLVATGVRYAGTAAEKVMPWLDARAELWSTMRTEVCTNASVEHTWDEHMVARASWCLEERRRAIAALVDELSHADAIMVSRAVEMGASLPDADTCVDEARLRLLPPPPPEQDRDDVAVVQVELARSDALRLAGHPNDAVELAARATETAEHFAWPPLHAAAMFSLGMAYSDAGRYADAATTLEQSYFAAQSTGSSEVAASCARALVHVFGYELARPEEGRHWGRLAAVELDRLGIGEDELPRIVLENALATADLASGSLDDARARYEHFLPLARARLGEDHPLIAAILNNYSEVERRGHDFAAAKRLQEESLAIKEKTFGQDHPIFALSLENLANIEHSLGAFERARDLHLRALAIEETTYGPDHPNVATALNDLGNVYNGMGESAMALPLFERALAIRERTLGPDHPLLASPLIGLSESTRDLRRYDEAIVAAERALRIDETATTSAEFLAQSRLAVASALWEADRDRARALQLARQAVDACAEAPDRGPTCDTVDRWLAEHAR